MYKCVSNVYTRSVQSQRYYLKGRRAMWAREVGGSRVYLKVNSTGMAIVRFCYPFLM